VSIGRKSKVRHRSFAIEASRAPFRETIDGPTPNRIAMPLEIAVDDADQAR
jgi:hypothetical protein